VDSSDDGKDGKVPPGRDFLFSRQQHQQQQCQSTKDVEPEVLQQNGDPDVAQLASGDDEQTVPAVEKGEAPAAIRTHSAEVREETVEPRGPGPDTSMLNIVDLPASVHQKQQMSAVMTHDGALHFKMNLNARDKERFESIKSKLKFNIGRTPTLVEAVVAFKKRRDYDSSERVAKAEARVVAPGRSADPQLAVVDSSAHVGLRTHPSGPMTIHVEPAPAVLQPVFALVYGKLVAGQPGKVARPMDLANQEPVDLPSMPTQEHTLEVPQSPPRHQGVTASAELDAAPPAFTRPEQMGASEVSHIAFD
jgi:hypothetical protein